MYRELHEQWRSRLTTLCDESAASHGAHIERVDGRAITYWPSRDLYVLVLIWPDGREVVAELDADEVALFDEIARASLRTLIDERIADAIKTKLGPSGVKAEAEPAKPRTTTKKHLGIPWEPKT